MGCRSDYNRCFTIIKTTISVCLFVFDIVTDIFLAARYFSTEHTAWAIWTTVFIAFPVIVYALLVVYMACVDEKWERLLALFWLPILMINNFLGVILYAWKVVRKGNGTTENHDNLYLVATISQVHEALLESAPQCVLQIYIILVDESITSKGGISVANLLSIITSVAMFTWSFVCYEKMVYYMYSRKKNHSKEERSSDDSFDDIKMDSREEKEDESRNDPHSGKEMQLRSQIAVSKMPLRSQIAVFVMKLCECSQRVMSVALFLSLLRLRFSVRISIVIFVCVLFAHLCILTFTDLCIKRKCKIKTIGSCLYASILRAICYTSTITIPNNKFRITFHYILVNLENLACVVIWAIYKPDTQSWLLGYVLGFFIPLFVFQLIFLIVSCICTDVFKSGKEIADKTKIGDEYFKYIACPCCTYCDE